MADQGLAGSGALKGIGLERVVPGETDRTLYLEHLGRYEFACRFVEGMRVLDVACGVGYGAPVLSKAGARSYLGIDVSTEALRLAESRYRISESVSFASGDACDLDGIEHGAFEVVVSFETIEHLENPERFLTRVREVLAPGGRFIVSTPNRTVYDPLHVVSSKPTNPFHVREWTVDEFVQLLEHFFLVDEVLGQGPCPDWKLVGRRLVAGCRPLRPVANIYRAVRSLGATAHSIFGAAATLPVEHLRPRHRPTYVVCVCTAPLRPGARTSLLAPKSPSRARGCAAV